MPCRSLLVLLLAGVPLVAAESDLPTNPDRTVQGAPELLRNDSGDPLFPETNLADAEFLTRTAPPNVERAKVTLEQAQRKEQRWQKLGKLGVLAKVEVEKATLQAARARVRYEEARVAQQEADLQALRARQPGAGAETIAAAEAALQTARSMAAEAAAVLQRTEFLIAEANVDRQRRLLKMGLGSRAILQSAEATLLRLQSPPAAQ